jgi:hypothetical protein
MAHTNQDRFANELIHQCNTFGKLYAAARILEKFSTARTRTRNRLLLSLLVGYQYRKDTAWCVALLRLLFFPMLHKAASRYPEFTWAEIQSAFYYAVEEYPLYRRDYALLAFRKLFFKALLGENTEDTQAQQLSEALQEALHTHSLSEVMGRDEKPNLSKTEVKHILVSWICMGLVPKEKACYVLARLFPRRVGRSACERQRASRGFRSVQQELKVIFGKS